MLAWSSLLRELELGTTTRQTLKIDSNSWDSIVIPFFSLFFPNTEKLQTLLSIWPSVTMDEGACSTPVIDSQAFAWKEWRRSQWQMIDKCSTYWKDARDEPELLYCLFSLQLFGGGNFSLSKLFVWKHH